MKKRHKALLSVCAALLVFGYVDPQANAANAPMAAKQQVINWSWSDDGDRDYRLFSEGDYWSAEELPTIELTVAPIAPSRRIFLESFDEETQDWVKVQETRTDRAGHAEFAIAPDCESDKYSNSPSWCDYQVTMRIRVLKVAGQNGRVSKTFDVAYATAEDDDWNDDNGN